MTMTIDVIYDGRVLTPQMPLNLKPNEHYSIILEDTPRIKAITEQPLATVKDDNGALAWRIYDANLKSILEPAQNGKIVAIDLDSEDYEVARLTIEAYKALKARRPNARIVALDIGTVSEHDPLEMRRNGLLRREVKQP